MEQNGGKHQNGWVHSCSQRSVEEHLQETSIGDGGAHLVEFSDAMRTVEKALRQVAESKARAQDEAAEWKRKYEMERLRAISIEQERDQEREQEPEQCQSPPDSWSRGEQLDSEKPDTENGEQSPVGSVNGWQPLHSNSECCKREGICSQQILRSHSSSSGNISQVSDAPQVAEKASFRLQWGNSGNKKAAKRHTHDVVSFECGNITTASRSSKQITLVWDSPPQSVFILSKPNSPTVTALCKEMIRWLKEEKGIGVYVEPSVKKELLDDSSYFSFVQSCETEDEVLQLHCKVDLVITLGGDGTVLWAANMFKGPVPPVVSFSMGSLGFMTPFQTDYKECLQTLIKGPVYITLRHRLHCEIVRNPDKVKEGEGPCDPEIHLVLNEVSIDRGMSSFLTNLECYCDDIFVTTVQGDGLILSTPSGSTAYSLAAGGSMVHPQVPAILFTPICPHSLSFRPLILPEYVTIRVQVPQNCRGQAWVSFDGKDRQHLSEGDALICHMSAWPVPAACDKESTTDFLRSVREGLHWNLRKRQGSDGHPSN